MFLSAITKNLNWEILNMILVTFRRWGKVRDEKFWYDVCSLKIRFLEGIHDKPIYRGDCLKRGAWTACRFNGCVGGGVIPQCTQCIQRILDGSMPVLVFKLCVQINEKWLPKHLIYSKPKAFNFLLSVFFFSKNNENYFHVMFQPLFTSYVFWTGVFCLFNTLLFILTIFKHF